MTCVYSLNINKSFINEFFFILKIFATKMYTINDKEFANATEALDYYISNFEFGDVTLSISKTTTAAKYHSLFDTNNLKLCKQKFSSLNNLSLGTNNESKACHEIEKLLNVLSHKIEDFKKDEINITKQAKLSTTDLTSKPADIVKSSASAADNSEDDPILKSLSKFESLNRQLSSTNLFERIDSSLNFNSIDSNLLSVNKPNDSLFPS